MKALRTCLVLLLVFSVLAAAGAMLFRRQWRDWQAVRRCARVFAAAEAARQHAMADPPDAAALSRYADSLVHEGNLGRALYLTELYQAQAPGLAGLRQEIEASIKASTTQEFHSVSKSAAAQPYRAEPLFQALLFLDGYREADLGDWASAKNYFVRIEEKCLAAPLRPYAEYYLARSYRLGGDDKQKRVAPDMLGKVLAGQPPPELADKIRYNLVAHYLSPAYEGSDGENRADQLLAGLKKTPGWPLQKALVEFGHFYLGKGDVANGWANAQAAIETKGNPEATGTALALCLETLARPEITQTSGTGPPALNVDGEVGEAMVRAAREPNELHQTIAALKILRTTLKRAEIPAVRGLAAAYAKAVNSDAAQPLRGVAAGFPDEGREVVYFNIAEAETAAQQWNAALADAKACASLGGPLAGDAWYQCYHILKKVQDPLNLEAAEGYLRQAVRSSNRSDKAVEELLPLLIYRGQANEAQRVVVNITGHQQSDVALGEMARMWEGRLGQKGQRDDTTHIWSYYEIVNKFPPDLAAAPGPDLPAAEDEAEFLLGLGLIPDANPLDSVNDWNRSSASELDIYLALRNDTSRLSRAAQAWRATQVLEAGAVTQTPILDYLLSLAYPRPYDDIVIPAAQRFHVPAVLIYAIIKKESGFKDSAVSGQGAEGLMQVMPDTAAFVNNSYHLGIDLARRTEPRNNILLGAANLRMLFDQLGEGNIRAVISAHNKGAGNYQKWRAQYPGADDVLFTELIPNEENEQFTKLVWKYYMIYKWLESRHQ